MLFHYSETQTRKRDMEQRAMVASQQTSERDEPVPSEDYSRGAQQAHADVSAEVRRVVDEHIIRLGRIAYILAPVMLPYRRETIELARNALDDAALQLAYAVKDALR